MTQPRIIPGLLLLLILILASTPDVSADEGVPLREARQAALTVARSQSLQTELPVLQTPRKLEPFPNARPKSIPSINPELIRFIFWASLILIAVIVILHLRGNVWSDSRSRRLRLDDKDAAPEAVAGRMDEARDTADGLAGSGGFAEAMHLLLLQSVNELRRRLDAMFADSLTSREILHSVQVPPEARAAFADIIARVELSYFGAREPDKDAYEACRRSYETLTATLKNAGSQEKTA